MSRLLSEQEKQCIYNEAFSNYYKTIEPDSEKAREHALYITNSSQFAKTDKEWMAWIERFIQSIQQTNLNVVDEINISIEQWQERKRSVGL